MRLLLLVSLLTASAHAQRWTIRATGLDTNLRGISVVNASGSSHHVVVWACGSSGVILRSVNQGKTWKRFHVQGGDALDFRGIVAFDATTAYVMSIGGGEKSRIYKTADGGESWTLEFSGKRSAFFLDDLVCISKTKCYGLSDPVDGKFLLVSTEDGEHWEELPNEQMPAALPGEGVFAASGTSLAIYDKREIYFGTGGASVARVFRSPDLGRTWTVADTPIASGNASSGIFSIIRTRNTVVVVGGDYKDPSRSDRVAAYSVDGGRTWRLATRQPEGFRSAVGTFSGANTGDVTIAVGPTGEDTSHDRGIHWTRAGNLNLNALAGTDTNHVWGVGPKGTIARLMPGRKYNP
ncbi:MAG: WD40/YVTN/BNR-like repeat-containing protein [Candidatus Acidiferrales bacterium]